MLALFKKNSFFNSMLLLGYAFVLHIIPAVMGAGNGYIFPNFQSKILAPVFHILILFIQAIFINRMVIENRLHRDIMLYPGVFFILYSSIWPEFWSLSHIHFANLMVIWAIHELFQIYKTNNPAIEIFNASFLIGLASIICPPTILYLFLVLIGVNNLKKMELVHPLQIIIGGVLPWFLWFTWQYWRGEGAEVFAAWAPHMGLNIFEIKLGTYEIIKLAIFCFILLFVVILYNEFRKKKHIQAQKKVDILYVALINAVIISLFHQPFSWSLMLFAAPVLGIFIGLFFSHVKNQLISETIHFILFVGVIISQLFHYIKFN